MLALARACSVRRSILGATVADHRKLIAAVRCLLEQMVNRRRAFAPQRFGMRAQRAFWQTQVWPSRRFCSRII